MSKQNESESEINQLNDDEKENLRRIIAEMQKLGMTRGETIAEVAKKMHPDAITILPLYRSCAVVVPQKDWQKYRGCWSIIMYGDPGAMGGDIDEEHLNDPMFKQEIIIYGQRFGPQILTGNGIEYRPIDQFQQDFYYKFEMERYSHKDGKIEDEKPKSRTHKDAG